MIDPVNHDELVQLVQNSAFDQLTPQQVEDLRQRLLSDADLNQVLRQSLEQTSPKTVANLNPDRGS